MFIMDEIRENTAGAIMTPEFVRLRADMRAGDALRAIRASGLDSDALYTIYVVDGADRLLGVLDVDSPLPGRFDEGDREGLEALARLLIAGCDWGA